ncbi:MAG: hypothetical protein IPM23_19605 [Candidatus Melainabacteria bacterium]|nr:hypothetical protein [Candidatus Melainabacteria bacterium]
MKSIKAYLLVLFQRALKLLFIFRPPPSGTALEPCDLIGEEDQVGKQEENNEGRDQARP